MPLPSPPPPSSILPTSSKRKRSHTPAPTAPPTSRLRTAFSPPPPQDQGSPRTAVAGHLQNLDLSETDFAPLDFRAADARFGFGKQEMGMEEIRKEEKGEEMEVPETPRLKPVRWGGEKLWWSEAEITGHDPKDPMDDGEGINGVGFLPVSSCFLFISTDTRKIPYCNSEPEGVGR